MLNQRLKVFLQKILTLIINFADNQQNEYNLTNYQKLKQNSIKYKMKKQYRFKPNPQKQEPINIVGYLDNSKLFNRQNQNKSHSKKQQNQSITSKLNFHLNRQQKQREERQFSPYTGRLTFLSQNQPKNQQERYEGFYTSRQNNQQGRNTVSFDIQNHSLSAKAHHTLNKKNLNVPPRNRFYYKSEYDSPKNIQHVNQSRIQDGEQSKYNKVLPNYFSNINKPQLQKREKSSQTQAKRSSRSKSPLEQSHNRLFSKCFKQAYQYLHILLKQIHKNQQDLFFNKKSIHQMIYKTVNQRAGILRDELYDLIQKSVSQWQIKQLEYIKKLQPHYMNDILDLQEYIQEKQSKIQLLIQQLEQQRKEQLSQNIYLPNKNRNWKKVTADLLTSDYQNSILQMNQLVLKMKSNQTIITNKAISLLPSNSMFSNTSHYEALNEQTKNQLKYCILDLLDKRSDMHKNFTNEEKQKPDLQKFRDSLYTLSQFKIRED